MNNQNLCWDYRNQCKYEPNRSLKNDNSTYLGVVFVDYGGASFGCNDALAVDVAFFVVGFC